MPTPASILKETFGYDSFRPLQSEVIENVLARRDTLAIMPTGGGKSLCYQIPALLMDGSTVVVSPLISLMKDQVEQLCAFGVPAVFLNSSLDSQEYQENMEYVQRDQVKLLYVAPETLLTSRIISGVGQVKSRQYGDAFLEVIKDYCKIHGLEEKQKETTREKSDSNRRYFIVGEAYNAGDTVESLINKHAQIYF